MSIGVIGRKVGMTQVFLPDGSMVPVSVVAVEPNRITAVRTPERDGYAAVQLGTEERKRLSKPRLGQLKGLPPLGTLREFRVEDVSGYEVGQVLDVGLFETGDLVHGEVLDHLDRPVVELACERAAEGEPLHLPGKALGV